MPWPYDLRCFNCHTQYPTQITNYRCEKCGGLLEVRFQISGGKTPWKNRGLSVWKYRELLPIDNDRFVTTLAEGGTGLHHCPRLGREIGLTRLFVKNEGENPTGSFKDRGMTVALSKARELGKRKVVCASTGNTAASLAASSARAGLKCIVIVPVGKVAAGKMLQLMIHGASIFQVSGDFDEAMRAVVTLTERRRTAETVTAKEIVQAQRELASKEGIFVEPASAASIAGLRKSREAGRVDRSDLVVCVTTGHGLKDPSVADHIPRHESHALKITQPNWIERLERML